MAKRDILQQLSFGQRVAEEERESLANYFVETDQWRRIFASEVDVVYGPKGAGKSALHAALLARANQLFDGNIIALPAENPRGAPAFKDLVDEPPATEREFISLWKLYFLCLAGSVLKDYAAPSPAAKQVVERLSEAGLLQVPPEKNLRAFLGSVTALVRKWFKSIQVESELTLDAAGNISGVGGKISFKEPKPEAAKAGIVSVDELLRTADDALDALGYDLWILLDRLDVAFAESPELEENALRALFKVYLEYNAFRRLKLKVFLRTDIWRRITAAGFREASHITRTVTIEWDKRSLLNLVVRRALQNKVIVEFYGVNAAEILQSNEAQEQFFYRVFPEKIEPSTRKPDTLEWMVGRTRDGTGQTAPRELIHLLNRARDVQLGHFDVGELEPPGEQLFTRQAIKDALPEVSKTRLEQTLYAEYPKFRERLEKMRREKAHHTIESLARIWGAAPEKAEELANELVEVGFFERRGSKESPEFWVPLLYRDGLDLVQGKAE